MDVRDLLFEDVVDVNALSEEEKSALSRFLSRCTKKYVGEAKYVRKTERGATEGTRFKGWLVYYVCPEGIKVVNFVASADGETVTKFALADSRREAVSKAKRAVMEALDDLRFRLSTKGGSRLDREVLGEIREMFEGLREEVL